MVQICMMRFHTEPPTTFVILHIIYHTLPQIDESAAYQLARFLLWHNRLLLSKLEVNISNHGRHLNFKIDNKLCIALLCEFQ